MGFLKKIKDTTEKGVDKGVDLGKKGESRKVPKLVQKHDGTKDACQERS